jgi:hypothetical protein
MSTSERIDGSPIWSSVPLNAVHDPGRGEVGLADVDLGPQRILGLLPQLVGDGDAQLHVARVQGLVEEVVRAQLETLDLLLDGRLLADEEDRDEGRLGPRPQRADEARDVEFRRGGVHDDDVGDGGGRLLEAQVAVAGFRDLVAPAFEGGGHGRLGVGIGIDDEDFDGGHAPKGSACSERRQRKTVLLRRARA